MRLAWFALLAACGGGSSEPVRSRTDTGVLAIATPAGPDDVVVAHVDGRPVYGSCVAAQAIGKTREAALDECIAFELLAQEADRRGFAHDPEVIEATRTALVSRTVELGFENRYRTPADLKDALDGHIERNKAILTRGEGRASAYARINVPKAATPAEEAEAKALVEKLAARLANETGLLPAHFKDAAREVFGGREHEVADVGYFGKDAVVPTYGEALFSIPDVGRIAPYAVRTRWGWEVILLTGILPPTRFTPEQAAIEAFPEVRRGYFQIWADQIARSLGVKIVIDPEQVAKLDEVGP